MGRNLLAIRANALLPGSCFLVSATPVENPFQALMVLIETAVLQVLVRNCLLIFSLNLIIFHMYVFVILLTLSFIFKSFFPFLGFALTALFDSSHVLSPCPLLDEQAKLPWSPIDPFAFLCTFFLNMSSQHIHHISEVSPGLRTV